MQRGADLLNMDLFARWSYIYGFRRMYIFLPAFLVEKEKNTWKLSDALLLVVSDWFDFFGFLR